MTRYPLGVTALALLACHSEAAPASSQAAGEGTATPAPPIASSRPGGDMADPFAYCVAVGTADVVDARYTGPKEPQAIRKQIGMDGMFTWRCVGGKVMACSYGANLPCGKANTSRAPSAAELEFCQENPGSQGIPAAITGHDTLFVWRCEGDKAVVERQSSHADDRGFVQEYWFEIRRP